jgi:uncharacterized damage-inducible protein DinB
MTSRIKLCSSLLTPSMRSYGTSRSGSRSPWIGVQGIETPFPVQPSAGFPNKADADLESWDQLRQRFFAGLQQVAAAANDESRHNQEVRCPSRPGNPVRIMTVREQLESLAAHNAYHFGRIVLLRQLRQAWPPPSGGFSW